MRARREGGGSPSTRGATQPTMLYTNNVQEAYVQLIRAIFAKGEALHVKTEHRYSKSAAALRIIGVRRKQFYLYNNIFRNVRLRLPHRE